MEISREFSGETTPQISSWLLTILKNTFFDYYRQAKTKPKAQVEVATWFEFFQSDSTPSANLISLEDEARLHAALSELETKYQRVLMLRHFEGLKFAKIAKRLESNPNSVATLYRRGLCKLANTLERLEASS